MQREAMRVELEHFDQQREPTEKVGEFAVYELLGAGAFGSVCRVRRGRNGPFYAMKKVCAQPHTRLFLKVQSNCNRTSHSSSLVQCLLRALSLWAELRAFRSYDLC